MQTFTQRKEQTFDDYISCYITDDNNVEYEVCFGLYHGVARWAFWQDTGFEFNIMEEVTLVFQEALNEEGFVVTLHKELIDKAEEIAEETYWERYSEGAYN